MFDRTYWADHVMSPSNRFTIVNHGDGTYTIQRTGTVMQQGTSQDAEHFNPIEEMLVSLETAVNLLANFSRQNAWEIERGQKTLTNSAVYPFNNSQTTVSLSTVRENGDYIVLTEVVSSDGPVGDIVVTDKLTNGFKISYTGSARSAVVKYKIIGGTLK